MLVFAALLATGAFAAVTYAHGASFTVQIAYYGAGFVVLFLGAHLAVRRFAPYADPLLLPLLAALSGIGLAMIYRIDLANADSAERAGRSVPSAYAPLQMVWTLVAVALFVGVLIVVKDHRALARYSYTAGLLGILLLLLPAVPGIGATINGARLWLRVGPLTFQPSEISKLLLLIFFAGFLMRKRDVLSVVTKSILGIPFPRARDLGPVLIAWGASLGMLFIENDLGQGILVFGMFLAVLYVATERVSWFIIGLLLAAAGAVIAFFTMPHVQPRFEIWLHAFQGNNPQGPSYQLVQGLFGFANGGILGTGWGQGAPQIVPFANTDFMMSSLGEELGLTGVMAILTIYLLLVMRGLRAAIGVRDSFGKLLAVGLAFSLCLQVFIIVGGVMRLIPLTGITLPLLSYGGSSTLSNFMLVALLVRISDAGRRPPTPATPLVDPAAAPDLIAATGPERVGPAEPAKTTPAEAPAETGAPTAPIAPTAPNAPAGSGERAP
jgi:cell division protein FtsW (lipid II flippase)